MACNEKSFGIFVRNDLYNIRFKPKYFKYFIYDNLLFKLLYTQDR